MANTYELINSTTVGAGTTPIIEFTSIPGTYTDLKLVLSLRSNQATTTDAANMTFNDSATDYSGKYIQVSSDNSVVSGSFGSTEISPCFIDVADSTANTFSTSEIYIPNYAGSDYKSMSAESAQENNSTGNAYKRISAGLWSNTAAITSIKFTLVLGTSYIQYSTAYLYGVKNA